AGLAIENSKLFHSVVAKNLDLIEAQDQLAARQAELNILFEIEKEINAALDLGELLDRLLRRAMDIVGAEAGAILLRERATDDLYFGGAAGGAGGVVKRLRVPMPRGVVGWVATHKRPLVVNAPPGDPRHDRRLAEAIGYRPRNLLCAP